MKVIILVGGKFHAFHLAKGLFNKGYLEVMFTSYPKFKIKEKIPAHMIQTIAIKEILKKIIDLFAPKKFYAKLNFYNDQLFDILASKQINNYTCDILVGWSGFSLNSFKNLADKKTIKIIERGSCHIKFQHDILKKEYQRLGLKPLLPSEEILSKEIKEYKEADYICVPSKFAKRSFTKKGFKNSKIKVLRLGVDLKKFYPKKIARKKKQFTIVSSGEVSVRKGSHILIEAFNNLKIQNAKLIFVGNIEKGLSNFLNKRKNSNIHFLGKKNEKQLNTIYNMSDIFVLNSLEDGFGMVVPQAMACGLPVITTFNTGASEIIENNKNGFVIKAGDCKSLENKIKKLYFNVTLRNKMSRNSLKKINKNFNWSSYSNSAINLYQKILKSSR